MRSPSRAFSTDDIWDTMTTLCFGSAPSPGSSSRFPGSVAFARFVVSAQTTTVEIREWLKTSSSRRLRVRIARPGAPVHPRDYEDVAPVDAGVPGIGSNRFTSEGTVRRLVTSRQVWGNGSCRTRTSGVDRLVPQAYRV